MSAVALPAMDSRFSHNSWSLSLDSGAVRIFPVGGKPCSAWRWSAVQGSAEPTAKRLGLALPSAVWQPFG